MSNKFVMVLLLLVFIVSLSSCNGLGVNKKKDLGNDKIYTGTSGVDFEFLNFPSKQTYSSTERSVNKFDFSVRVVNEGASFSKGAVFISGYNPSWIKIDGIDFKKTNGGLGPCDVDFTFTGTDSWSNVMGSVKCIGNGVNFGMRDGNFCWGLNSDNLGKLGVASGMFDSADDAGFLSNVGVNIDGCGKNVDSVNFNINYDGKDMELLYHGAFMYLTLGSVDFTPYYGREFKLEGWNYRNPVQDSDYIDYSAEIVGFPMGQDQVDMSFLFTTCYLYSTYASATVCIDPMPDSEAEKNCKVQNHINIGSTGGPLVVTGVDVEASPRITYFTINIKNEGNGKLIHPGKITRCAPQNMEMLTKKDLNVVIPYGISVDNQKLDCKPSGELRLKEDGTGQIVCKFKTDYMSQSAFERTLAMEFWYGYSNSVKKSLKIKRYD